MSFDFYNLVSPAHSLKSAFFSTYITSLLGDMDVRLTIVVKKKNGTQTGGNEFLQKAQNLSKIGSFSGQ